MNGTIGHTQDSRFATNEAAKSSPRRNRRFVFWLLMVFFVLEYIRPEPIINLKIQMACLVVFPILWLFEPKRPWSRNLTLQVAFLGLCALSVPFASNNYWAYITTRIVYGYVVIALAITWFLANRRDFTFAVWFWVLMMAFQAFYGITHEGRGYGGMSGDENDLALGLNTAIPFVFVGFRTFRGWKRWGCGMLLALIVSGIVASLSRGGFIGLVAAILYCVMMGRNRIRNISIALIGGLVFYLSIPASYKGEIASIQQTDSGTAEQRFFFWTAAINMWRANPILGVGAGNSSWQMGAYQPAGRASGLFSGREYHERDYTMSPVHSVYFQVLSETGTLGTVLFIAILSGHFTGLYTLRRRVRRDRRASRTLRNNVELYTVALGGAMVGYLAAGAFLSVAYYPYPWYFSAFTVALTRAVDAELARSHSSRDRGAGYRAFQR